MVAGRSWETRTAFALPCQQLLPISETRMGLHSLPCPLQHASLHEIQPVLYRSVVCVNVWVGATAFLPLHCSRGDHHKAAINERLPAAVRSLCADLFVHGPGIPFAAVAGAGCLTSCLSPPTSTPGLSSMLGMPCVAALCCSSRP